MWHLYAASLLLFAVMFGIWHVEPVPPLAWLSGCFVWAVATFPLTIWYQRHQRGLPMFELVCIAYGFAYGVALFTTPDWIVIASHRIDLDWDLIEWAALLAGMGVFTGILTFFAVNRSLAHFGMGPLSLAVPVSTRTPYIAACLSLGLAAKVFDLFHPSSEAAYGAIVTAAAGQFYIGLVVLAYDSFQGQKSQVPLIAVTAFATAIGLLGGMMETAMLPLVLVIIVRWYVRRRLSLVLAALTALFFFVVNPIKYQYRELTWSGQESVSAADRVLNWLQAAQTTYLDFKDPLANNPDEEADTPIDGTMQRIDLLHKFAYIESMTPHTVPYLGGLSYNYLLYTFIPRLIWPDKPKATESTDLVDFAYGFRFYDQENRGTNIGAGFIAEAYANFSWWGVIMVLGIQGVIFGVLDRLLNDDRYIGGQAIYATVMMLFLNGIGTSAVVLFGNIVQFTVVSILFQRLFCGSAAFLRRDVQFGRAAPPSRMLRPTVGTK